MPPVVEYGDHALANWHHLPFFFFFVNKRKCKMIDLLWVALLPTSVTTLKSLHLSLCLTLPPCSLSLILCRVGVPERWVEKADICLTKSLGGGQPSFIHFQIHSVPFHLVIRHSCPLPCSSRAPLPCVWLVGVCFRQELDKKSGGGAKTKQRTMVCIFLPLSFRLSHPRFPILRIVTSVVCC